MMIYYEDEYIWRWKIEWIESAIDAQMKTKKEEEEWNKIWWIIYEERYNDDTMKYDYEILKHIRNEKMKYYDDHDEWNDEIW